jgi:DNA-binding LacI/PurR family transcriptional regulator
MTSTDPIDEGLTRRRPRAPVMSDVGRLAGVSHQTVSRVINGSPHVRPETRNRVVAAMEELGHETVWHITGPPNFIESRQRLKGWRTTLERAGADLPEPLVGDWSPRAGYDLGRRLSRERAVTAVFVANDQMALGLLRAMHEAGREVPGELSVVGFDDIPEASYFLPPLTTVRQDFNEMGRRSLRALLRTIETGEPPSSGMLVSPELIVRASTGPARRRD